MWSLTRRGRVLVAACLGLFFSAILFQGNLIIFGALLALAGLFTGEVAWLGIVLENPERWFELEGSQESLHFTKRLKPGETASERFFLRNKGEGDLELSADSEYLHVNPSTVSHSNRSIEIIASFSSPFAGKYSANKLHVALTGPLGFLRGNCVLKDLSFQVTVVPKVLDVAVTTSKLLGRGGIGENPIDRPGIGTEFYEMRPYESGDDYRLVNWKASARQRELMVNEKMREVGSAIYLVLEAFAPEYFDIDRLASAFLNTANSLAISRTRFGVIVHDGNEVLAFRRIDDPIKSLNFALGVALKFADITKEEELSLHPSGIEELTPITSYDLKLSSRTLEQTNGAQMLSQLEGAGGKYQHQKLLLHSGDAIPQKLVDLVREYQVGERPAVIYISGLFHWNKETATSLSSIVELGAHLKRVHGADLVVLDPTAPWVAAGTEEEACTEYQNHLRKLKALRTAGIEYGIGDSFAAVQNVLSK